MSEEEVLPTSTPLDDFGSVLDDWIAGASLTRILVTIYGAGHLVAEVKRLESERELLELELSGLEDDDAETSLSESSRATEVRARLDEVFEAQTQIHDEWLASKSVWIVEDISKQDDAIRERIGDAPTAPEKPVLAKGASDAQKRSHTLKMQAYEVAVKEYETAANEWSRVYGLESAAAAVVRVEFPDGRQVDAVTPAQIEALGERVGQKQILNLHNAIREAMLGEPVVDAPLSLTTSPDETI